MMNTEQFVAASRAKLRFETSKGLLTVEDLWDLPLDRGKVNLDDLAMGIQRELKGEGESFVNKTKGVNAELKMKLDVLVGIIEIRIAERDAALDAQVRKEKKQQILDIIARKENADLEGKSLDELKSLLTNL